MQSNAGGSSYLQAQCAMCRGPDRQVSRKVKRGQGIEGVRGPAGLEAHPAQPTTEDAAEGCISVLESVLEGGGPRTCWLAGIAGQHHWLTAPSHHGGVVIRPVWASSPIQHPGLTNGPCIGCRQGLYATGGEALMGRSKACRGRHPGSACSIQRFFDNSLACCR